jgi:hypothetical protein
MELHRPLDMMIAKHGACALASFMQNSSNSPQ